jgi:diguanylate cyclase (GGDEF)-like protein/PAS domain S-box-containing protein
MATKLTGDRTANAHGGTIDGQPSLPAAMRHAVLAGQLKQATLEDGTVCIEHLISLVEATYDAFDRYQRDHGEDCGRRTQPGDVDTAYRELTTFSSLFENAAVGIYRTTLDGRQLRANPAYVRMNGYGSEAEMLAAMNNIAVDWYVDPDRRSAFVAEIEKNGLVTDFISEVYRHKTRQRMWVSESGWIVRDRNGNPLFYEGSIVDATERMRAEVEIAHLAHFDSLTGLANRTYFARELKAVSALEDGKRCTVLCLDLDNFKDVNDTLGHHAGDQLLMIAANRIRLAAGKDALVVRLGGDEFAILLRGADDAAVQAIAERVISDLSLPFDLCGKEAVVGVSIGIAHTPDHGNAPGELQRNADIALYRAKAAGRRRAVTFDPAMVREVQERRELETDLRRALMHDEFCLYYQPIVDAATRRTVCMEALIRWNHPTRGLVPPGAFISVAEEAGLMHRLGRWVIRQAIADLAHVPETLGISINLSPVQFRTDGLPELIATALREHRVAPSRLTLEITESVLLVDDPLTRETLEALRNLGVELALDDFGIGFSSLSYLQKFVFDKIKIDRSFASEVHNNPTAGALVRTIATLGRELGILVVAEGIETAEQLQILSQEGCRWFQGYYFSRPAPLAEQMLGELRGLVARAFMPDAALQFEPERAVARCS